MKKEERKQQILGQACALFAGQGYDATTVAQIAKQCGCSPSLIIRHFGSKENVYDALLDKLREACRQPLLTIDPTGSTMEKIETVYNAFAFEMQPFSQAHAELLSALQSRANTQSVRSEIMKSLQDVGLDIFKPLIQAGVEDGSLPAELPCEKTARVLWLFINGANTIRSNYDHVKTFSFSEVRRLLLES